VSEEKRKKAILWRSEEEGALRGKGALAKRKRAHMKGALEGCTTEEGGRTCSYRRAEVLPN
jgi:hypothetical protein